MLHVNELMLLLMWIGTCSDVFKSQILVRLRDFSKLMESKHTDFLISLWSHEYIFFYKCTCTWPVYSLPENKVAPAGTPEKQQANRDTEMLSEFFTWKTYVLLFFWLLQQVQCMYVVPVYDLYNITPIQLTSWCQIPQNSEFKP